MAAQAGLCLAWLETPEDTFCRVVAHVHANSQYQQGKGSQRKQMPSSSNASAKTLLIGDSLLSSVNKKGLRNNVHCQPFPGATVSTIHNCQQN